jgi:dTDP-4-dehydrorhamnose reductase
LAKKVLVLGASSYVGRHLIARLQPENVLATHRANPVPNGVYFDSLDMRLDQIIGDPDAYSHAVILLGDTEPDSCYQDPAKSNATNFESVCSVFDQLSDLGIKPIFTSSEFVFDGENGAYVETDDANPILLYGEQKLKAEQYLADSGAPHTILRLSKVYGDDIDDGTLFSGWLTGLRSGMTMKCAADQAFSPVFVGDVVAAILQTIERNLNGLYHVSGNQHFRRIELLEIAVRELDRQVGGFNINIESCSINDFPLPEKRPIDVSMSADKIIRDAGLEPQNIEKHCARMVRENRKRIEAGIHEHHN